MENEEAIINHIYEMDWDELREYAAGLVESMASMELEAEKGSRDMQKYRERLGRRDNQIRRMVQCLRAIAEDDDGHGGPCNCNHDAMAKDALKHYRKTLDPANIDDKIHLVESSPKSSLHERLMERKANQAYAASREMGEGG